MPKYINVVVVGVSGSDNVKGASGVGKSMLCNRFIRPSADDFIGEHCSVLSEIDFFGSPVINKDHWLYWGSRSLEIAENSSVVVRVVEQTEFLSDETYDTIAKSANNENYIQRCVRTVLRSPDKLMYIQKEQLGSENEFPQELFPDGTFTVDGFVIVWDVSRDEQAHYAFMRNIINAISKTKKPAMIAFTKSDEMIEASKANFLSIMTSAKRFKNMLIPPVETCSLKNVNIEFVFRSLALLCSRSFKNHDKPLSYREEARRVEQQNIHIKYSFTLLLSQTVPLHEWPRRYSKWEQVLVDLDRNPDLVNFVTVFGSQVANEMYEKYAMEAKNFNTINRLRAFVPRLFQVFEEFEKLSGIVDMDWLTAKDIIMSHDYFSTLFDNSEHGLNSYRCGYSNNWKESKLPAEVLLLPEARHSFDDFKASKLNLRYWSKLSEELEEFLNQESHVYPGSEIEEVLPYIEDFCLNKNIPKNLVADVYQNHQKRLIKKARSSVEECVMEVLPVLACRWADCSFNDDLLINQYLADHLPYYNIRQLKSLRNEVIKDCMMFLNEPSYMTCPSNSGCLDLVRNQRISGHIQLESSADFWLQNCAMQIYAFCGDKLLFDPFVVAVEDTLGSFQEFASPVNEILSSTIDYNSDIFYFDINIRSYHSEWMFTIEVTTGTHILTYDGSRRASFEHAQAVIEKLCMMNDVDPRAIILVALVCEDDAYLDFVIEGAELSKAVGAKFVILNVDNSCSLKNRVMDLFNLICEDTSEKNKQITSHSMNERETNERPSVLMPPILKIEVPLRTGENVASSALTRMGFSSDENLRVNFTEPAVMSKFYQPVFGKLPAPLATPETVEFSPIYSKVDDLLKPAKVAENDNLFTSQKHGVQSHVLCKENPSQISRRVSRLSLSTDSINRLHRTSNLIVSPLSKDDRKFTSTDSLCDKSATQKEQRPQNRFVRKVASSFRLKKNFLGLDTEEKTDVRPKRSENNLLPVEKHTSRSLPQSPRTDRKSKIYTSINNTTGKVSNVLSWLPSKSSKILFKNKSATYDLSASVSSFTTVATSTRGVILPNQNLRVLCAASNTGIPVYITKCIEFIEQNGGFEQEGLYRIPGNQTHLIELEFNFLSTGNFEALHFDSPIHVAATALKNFFSCLPEALISSEFHNCFKNILSAQKNEEQRNTISEIITALPAANQRVLLYLISHLGRVARSAKTIMNAHNLSKVWTPTLFRPSFASYEELASGIMAFQLNLEFLINNYNAIQLKESNDS